MAGKNFKSFALFCFVFSALVGLGFMAIPALGSVARHFTALTDLGFLLRWSAVVF